MPLRIIRDGYTLPFATSPTVTDPVTGEVLFADLPVVSGEYRPPTYDELHAFRFAYNRCTDGTQQAKLSAEFVAARVKSWDILDGEKAAPVTSEVVLLCGEPIASQLLNLTSKWGPKSSKCSSQADSAGN